MKRIIALIIACVLFCTCVSTQVYGDDTSNDKALYEDLYNVSMEAYDFIRDTYANKGKVFITDETAKNAGTSTMDWIVITLSRLGIEDNYDLYLEKLTDYVISKYESEGGLSSTKATEYHRIALAILACGGNPRCIGKNKIDLIKDGVYDRNNVAPLDAQGINGEIWALIAVDSADYDVPQEAYYTRKKIIENIISKQMEDGSFGLIEGQADADITAMVITALSNYYNSDEKYQINNKNTNETKEIEIKEVVDKAVEALSKLQLASGAYMSDGNENASSTGQVIIALTSLDIDILEDERFIKNGNSLLDGLMKYKMDNGGFYRKKGDEDIFDMIDTQQALLAISSILRQNENKSKIYDFSQEIIENNKENGTEKNQLAIYICLTGIVAILIVVILVIGIIVRKRKTTQEN